MITDKRLFYKPFEYEQAHEFLKSQQRVHWLPEEVALSADINDFKLKLTESEKNLIGQILKSFAQTETHVEDYWSSYVSKWFPKPEIQSMAVTFSSFESIHAEAYSLLNESLGLDNFAAFMEDEEARNKIERLQDVHSDTIEEIAQSLAIFSAFTEGVNLFSSFAILMSFQMRNLMKGMGQIVAWSVRDESLHSTAGCWLFNQLLEERPEVNTLDLQEKIKEACRISVNLEFAFIDKVFEMGDLENITKEQLKNFIKARANEKMIELKYKPLYEVDEILLDEISWFGQITSGVEHQDFFTLRSSAYSKSVADWSDL
jgi:ribonucleoside-diphosphate reductase beta chain